MNVPMPPPAPPVPAGSGEPRSGVPAWLLPAGIGAVVALVLVLIVVALTGGDDDESVAPATSASSAPTSSMDTSPDTTVAATTATTAITATTTAVPSTTAAATTVPETTTSTDVPTPVGPGTAAITSSGVTSSYTIAVTCSDFWAGVETTSHVLVDDATGAVWVANVYAGEEGGQRGLHAVDMAAAIAGVLEGLDTPGSSPTYAGDLDDSIAGLTRTTAELTSGDGPSSIDIEIGEPATADDCSTGSLEAPSPFAIDEQVVWQPSDNTMGRRFNVLARCGGELLLSGGALLVSSYPEDGNTMIALMANAFVQMGEDVVFSNDVTPESEETYFEQGSGGGGGGDALAAIQVFRDGDRSSEPLYLEWTERPLRSAVGDAGLLDEVCPAP